MTNLFKINKILILFIYSICFAGFSIPPKPQGPVADFAHVISISDKEKIETIASSLWKQGNFGLVVVTIENSENEVIDDIATRIYESWGIGKKGKDEGALVLISMNPRKVRIEAGYGSEGYLNDAICGRILDQYGIPYFKANDFSKGLLSISSVIAAVVSQEKGISLQTGFSPRRSPSVNKEFSVFHLIFFMIAAAFLLGTPFGRSLLFWMLVSGLFRGGRGGFGGGFGGGGFGGGFGGGMSGGGGASRGF